MSIMKKILRSLLILLSLALMLTLLSACDNGKPNDNGDPQDSDSESGSEYSTETSDDTPQVPTYALVSDGSTEYSIVTSALASDEIINAANNLKKVFKNKTDADIELKTDRYNTANPNYVFPKYEILIGETNRPESEQCAEGLAYDDYVIKVINGKIVVLGGSDGATAAGVDKLKEYINGKSIDICDGQIDVYYDHQYDVKKLSIAGHDISEFSIKMESRSKCTDIADDIIKTVRKLYGVTLEAEVGKSAGADACEIIIGNVSAQGSDKMPKLSVDEYAVYVSGNKVFIDGGSAVALQKFGTKIYEHYTKSGLKGEVDIKLSTSPKAESVSISEYPLADGATFRIMSNNILFDGIANRAELIIAKYLEYFPDIIGLQECNSTGHSAVVKKLSDFYGSAVAVQDDKDIAPYTPILYRKDKYKVVAEGSYFFESRYTKTNTKSLTWAVFEDLTTGQRFGVINAHYALITDKYDLPADYTNAVQGAQWREDNSRQMIERAQIIRNTYGADTPVFLMGDLNSNKNAKSIKMLEDVFDDAMNVATVSSSKNIGSFHKEPGLSPTATNPIDFIFLDSSTVNVYTHKILTDNSSLKISDHSPVVVDLSFRSSK